MTIIKCSVIMSSSLNKTAVRVIAIEIAVITVLWVVGRVFGA
jgi:hypothetical protein